jgi:hypothetical protein
MKKEIERKREGERGEMKRGWIEDGFGMSNVVYERCKKKS